MSTITPSWQGEVQFRRYSDTSTQGQQLVFAVHGREELESFIGKEGKRFMAVLVEIGDDEQAVQPIAKPKEREHLGDFCYRAVMMANSIEFRHWAHGQTHGAHTYSVENEREAGFFIRSLCEVDSRKELDTDLGAADRFRRRILGPWQKYQIARRSA